MFTILTNEPLRSLKDRSIATHKWRFHIIESIAFDHTINFIPGSWTLCDLGLIPELVKIIMAGNRK